MNMTKMIRWSLVAGLSFLGVSACSSTTLPGDGDGDGNGNCPGLKQCGTTCVNTQADPANCGDCGSSCGNGLVCSAGQCSATCGGGLTQCGASCENTQTSLTSCGGCDRPCAGVCQGGVCSTGQVGSGGGTGSGGSGDGTSSGGSGDGTSSGGSVGSGGGSNTGDPAGFWRYDSWKGCAWTGVDATSAGTTIMPQDFKTRAVGEPYCASGTVGPHPDYESVALLGFNLNEDPATADCSYDPNTATSAGPPGVQMTETGIAANIVKQGSDTSFTFRVQIQGQNGATDANDRWCATITATQGKIFVPYTDFNTECWTATSTTPATGTPYNNEPISAVVFLVPGEPTALPYNFCVNGFAAGNSAADAPDGTAEVGEQSGKVGFTNVSPDGDFDRAKVLVDGEEYIIQNNNWGNPTNTNLVLSYTDNSFKITEGSGSSPGGGIPASFPSIYIGGNGNTQNGVMATRGTDNLPKQISAITSAPSSFAWSGSTSSFNATYDIWFANSPPSGEYNDGIDGFIMIWVYKPSDEQPIGSDQGDFTYNQKTYDVWVGPRGDGPEGYNDAPVVSFVARESISSGDIDLKPFFTEAAKYGITANMYLTDVFFGFEIWNGGAGGNLGVNKFTCDVK